MHVSSQIAAALQARLSARVASVGGRVFRSRVHQIADREMPCLLVAFDGESVAHDQGQRYHPRIQSRTSRWAVVGVVRARGVGTEDLEDALLALAREVEEALLDSEDIGPVHNLALTGTDLQMADEGESPVGYVRLALQAVARTREGAPAAPL